MLPFECLTQGYFYTAKITGPPDLSQLYKFLAHKLHSLGFDHVDPSPEFRRPREKLTRASSRYTHFRLIRTLSQLRTVALCILSTPVPHSRHLTLPNGSLLCRSTNSVTTVWERSHYIQPHARADMEDITPCCTRQFLMRLLILQIQSTPVELDLHPCSSRRPILL